MSRNTTQGWKGTQGAAKAAVRLHQARWAAAALEPGLVALICYWKVPGDEEKRLSERAGEPADRMVTEVFTGAASPLGNLWV